MLVYPHIEPVIFSIGPLDIHWYGLMYLIGFLAAWLLAKVRANQMTNPLSSDNVSDLIFYAALGVIVGGRVGYMLFYDLGAFLQSPWKIFYLWDGGMSFHGGLVGVLVALWLYARHLGRSFFELSDFIAPMVPIGLGAGRVGNFINGELWGRVGDVPWAMIYPHVDNLPRHPSEIYQFLTEGVLLFIILWRYSASKRPPRAVSGLFLLLYGLFRFFTENYRQPDDALGFVAFDYLTMGQVLSIPMILFGTYLLIGAYCRCDKWSFSQQNSK